MKTFICILIGVVLGFMFAIISMNFIFIMQMVVSIMCLRYLFGKL